MTVISGQPSVLGGVSLPTETMTIMMGPVHPAMYGTVRIVVTVDGERIVHADVIPIFGSLNMMGGECDR